MKIFCLLMSLTVATAAAASSTGTLVVEIVAGVDNAYKHDKGRTAWVYLSGDDVTVGTKQLFGKGKITDQPHRGGDVVVRVQGDVLPGRYRFILVGAASPEMSRHGTWYGGVTANRICQGVAEVKAGAVTRIKLGPELRCFVAARDSGSGKEMGYHPLSGPGVPLSSATATLLRYQTAVEETKADCDKQAASLFDLYEKIKATPPRRPLIVLSNAPGASLGTLEYDAEQIRFMVEYLTTVCWYNGYPEYVGKFQLGSQERQMAEILDETVSRERFKLRRLNGVAEILESVEQRQRR